jgi:alpha-tubulin suppressor-like RCC1 family protein
VAGVIAIAAGTYHSLALKSDGTVVAWGCNRPNDYGQCSVPVGLAGVIAIAASDSDSLALKGDGTVVAWGCGADTLGYLHDAGQCSVPAGLAGVTAISADVDHSLALKRDGSVVAWGCIAHPPLIFCGGLRTMQRAVRPCRRDRNRRWIRAQRRVERGRHRGHLGLRQQP